MIKILLYNIYLHPNLRNYKSEEFENNIINHFHKVLTVYRTFFYHFPVMKGNRLLCHVITHNLNKLLLYEHFRQTVGASTRYVRSGWMESHV